MHRSLNKKKRKSVAPTRKKLFFGVIIFLLIIGGMVLFISQNEMIESKILPFFEKLSIVSAATTCTCPGLHKNWEINLSDFCELNTTCNLGVGTLKFSGSGYANCSAKINTSDLEDPGPSGIFYISSGCLISIFNRTVVIPAGEIIVTEIMVDTFAVSDLVGEWFEIYNTNLSIAYNLKGVTFRDDGLDSFTVVGDLWIQPISYLVFCINGDSGVNGGITNCAYDYAGMNLANSDDEIDIERFDGLVIDESSYAAFSNGVSLSLDPDFLTATGNDNAANWCNAINPYGSGDLGTPGTANPECGA